MPSQKRCEWCTLRIVCNSRPQSCNLACESRSSTPLPLRTEYATGEFLAANHLTIAPERHLISKRRRRGTACEHGEGASRVFAPLRRGSSLLRRSVLLSASSALRFGGIMDTILSDDERAKIRAEETFRHEVRKGLEETGSRWWAFLNSAFGLWLLGSVSVGVITWSFGAIHDRQREETESRALSRRLRTEIAARIDAATYVFRSSEFHEPRPEVDDYGEAANILNGQVGHATYADLTGRKLSSLVIQLRDNGLCNYDLEPSVKAAQLLEADFTKWRRRGIVAYELGAPDYSSARKSLDKKFVSELGAINMQVANACK